MEAALGDFEYLAFAAATQAIDKPVFLCNPAGPKAFEIVLERLWFTRAAKWVALAFFNQSIEFSQCFRVIC
jgi:hypothetical protein